MEQNALNLLKAVKNHVDSQYNSIIYHKKNLILRRKMELKNNMNIVFGILRSLYNDSKNGHMTEADAQKKAISCIQTLRYDHGIGYFWINDTTRPYPKMIMHPTIPQLNGKILDDPIFNSVLGTNENLFKLFVKKCLKSREGYVSYYWEKPLSNRRKSYSKFLMEKFLNLGIGS